MMKRILEINNNGEIHYEVQYKYFFWWNIKFLMGLWAQR